MQFYLASRNTHLSVDLSRGVLQERTVRKSQRNVTQVNVFKDQTRFNAGGLRSSQEHADEGWQPEC